ncbi:MAG: hypothetical protein JNM91_12700 [Flavobacteriales bacterium]|nr:hypothetical protein [Flavobacteriales bacterium]
MIASDGTNPLLQRTSLRGRLKVDIGKSAGVGKSYRKLEEAHELLAKGVNIPVGFLETPNRVQTHALLNGLPLMDKHVTSLCVGKPHFGIWQMIMRTNTFRRLLLALSENDVDLVILS